MEKNNPLLPFAFTSSSFNDPLPLNTTPRHRSIIDENASSQYHTRTSSSINNQTTSTNDFNHLRRKLDFAPRLKRKMGESFNERDDVKRIDTHVSSEQPTEIDIDNSDNDVDDDYDNDNNEPYSLPPSSPLLDIPLISEFDFNTNTHRNYPIPDSPKANFAEIPPSEIEHLFIQPSPRKKVDINESPSRRRNRVILSSDADFGIDRFNRFKGASGSFNNQLPSSMGDNMDETSYESLRQSSYDKARSIILHSFEEVKTIINLESMNLYELPDEIKDMNKLVIFGNNNNQLDLALYQLYLSNNKLYMVPPTLFKFTKLNVLSLRQNRLTYLPPLIEKLTNLMDISLGANQLEWLPWQILNLPKLHTLLAGPNPFKPIPNDDDIPNTAAIPMNIVYNNHKCKYRTPIISLTNRPTPVPSLKNLCLNQIAKYDVTYKETKTWKRSIPKVHHNSIIQAITKGKYGDVCNQCIVIIVEPMAEVYEWWDILMNKNVPIRKQFCCQSCVERYLNSIREE